MVPPGPIFYSSVMSVFPLRLVTTGKQVRHTSFLVSISGKELSKALRSSCAPLDGCAGADMKSPSPPPRKSSSPSSTVAALGRSLAAKRSASSPRRARSRSRKLPCAAESGRTSVSPGRILDPKFHGKKVRRGLNAPASMSSMDGNRSAMAGSY